MSSQPSNKVFDEWKSAKNNLEHAATTFLSACTALLQYVEKSSIASTRSRSIEDVVMGVLDEMGSVSAIEQQTVKSRVVVRKIINMSTTRVPINKIPAEILSGIFSLIVSSSSCVAKTSPCYVHPLVVIPAVCARWRHLATNIRSLWSHVDISKRHTMEGDNGSVQQTSLWTERGSDAPLHLHIDSLSLNRGDETHLISRLEPHIAKAMSMDFTGTNTGISVQAVLGLYASHCPSKSLSSLQVLYMLPSQTSAGSIWSIRALWGLTDLRLVRIARENAPSLDDLVSILSNSPALRTFRLQFVPIQSTVGHAYPEISMPRLQLLQLVAVGNQALPKILSIMLPGPLELDVRLSLPAGDNLADVVSFFNRSNIACLSFTHIGSGSIQRLPEYLSCVPGLRIFGVNCSSDQQLASLEALTVPAEGCTFRPRCPSLQLLWMTDMRLGSQAQAHLKRIVSCYRLSTIVFENSNVGMGEDMIEWLRQRVGSVVCNHNGQKFGLFIS